MASFASLVSLGSTCTCSPGQLEGTRLSIRRVYFPNSSCSFHNLLVGKKWRYVSICKYSVTTDYIADQGTSISLNATNKSSQDDASDLLLKPTRPILKPPEPKIAQVSNGSGREKLDVQERNKVIESLDDVLEKAEKLESSKNSDIPNKKPSIPIRTNTNPDANRVNSAAGKAKTLKSVWRKGNPIANVEKVVKEATKIEKVPEKLESRVEVESQQPVAQPPQRFQPQLQAKPLTAPPVKRPTILKDLGAAPKAPSTTSSSTTDEKDSSTKTKERSGPILIDKFASKRSAVDPLMAQAVLAPPKPGKVPPSGRFKDDFRKKSGAVGSPRRRMVQDDGIHDEETSELDVSIPGAKKGKKVE